MNIQNNFSIPKGIQAAANYFFFFMGGMFVFASLCILVISFRRLFDCFVNQCDSILGLVDFVGLLIISVAIFDVGRYLWEEEVFKDRSLKSPREARRSLTKFMVIIVIAVSLEALLNVIKASKSDVKLLLFPAALFLVATFLLIGLGLYQKYSIKAEEILDKSD